MDEPSIKDIPSIKKSLEDAKNMAAIKTAMPILRPILKLFGTEVDKIDEALNNVEELTQMAKDMARIPDEFNDLFSSRGWIIYDLLNFEVAKSAVDKAKSGDIDGAEIDLVEYYSPETVRWKLRTMIGLEAFRPRMRLAQKALTDYEDERYHACIPVVLALLDGLVSELHEKRRGFFAREVDLTAWDSIAAHSKGLNVLAGIFQKGRRKPTTEEITIPYRHGILHGMDLGYDNKIVAAKTWAALFSVRDWAIKAERDMLEPPPEEPEKTLIQSYQGMKEALAERDRLKEWKSFELTGGENIPLSGSPDSYDNGSAEKTVSEFLTFWFANNYGFMARCLSKKFGPPEKSAPAEVRKAFEHKKLKEFKINTVKYILPTVSDVDVDLEYFTENTSIEKSVKFHLVKDDDDEGEITYSDKTDFGWVIVNWQI